jgi:outer membrane protein insertion porin family
MRQYYTIIIIFLISAGFGLGSCKVTRHLDEGAYLLKKNKILIVDSDSFKDGRSIEYDLYDFTYPRPNKRFLGYYFKLRTWYGSRDTSKGFNRWLRRRIAEPPALIDTSTFNAALKNINQYLFNKGYFHSAVTYKIDTLKNKKAIVNYLVERRKNTGINEVTYASNDTAMLKLILIHLSESLIKPDKPYDVHQLLDERNRITSLMQDNGYYYFNKQYIVFALDTLPGKDKLDVMVNVNIPETDTMNRVYTIGNISIYPDYSSIAFDNTLSVDTLNRNGIDIIYHQLNFNPNALLDRLNLKEGDLYSKELEQLTLNRFTSLSVFRFANLGFTSIKRDGKDVLDVKIFLEPAKAMNVTFNYNVNTSNYYFLGTEFGINYQNKNLVKYTDLFQIGFNAGLEFLNDSARSFFVNTLDIKGNANLTIPKFILPFKMRPVPKNYQPKTIFNALANYYRRLDYYTLNSYRLTMSYDWNEAVNKRHVLSPFDFTYVKLSDTTSAFSDAVKNNPALRKSFEDQMILGVKYTFLYNNQHKNPRKFFLWRSSFEMAGNLLFLINRAIYGSSENAYHFLGRPFNQFIRTEQELRIVQMHKVKERGFVLRIIGGIAVPYLNSEVMPYVKQFVIGGANSIRAFRIREIGPGAFKGPPSTEGGTVYNDRAGDIKIETNIEYRFPLSKTFKGAFFVDAGNIWMLRETQGIENGEFRIDQFYKQLYIGTGFGLRMDFSFFLIRLDFGIPLHDPRIDENNGWRWDQLGSDIFSNKWRSENLIFNFAIGYPF